MCVVLVHSVNLLTRCPANYCDTGGTPASEGRNTMSMHKTFVSLMKNEDGATAIEYGLIAALIAVAAIAAFQLVGTNLSGIFNSVGTQL